MPFLEERLRLLSFVGILLRLRSSSNLMLSLFLPLLRSLREDLLLLLLSVLTELIDPSGIYGSDVCFLRGFSDFTSSCETTSGFSVKATDLRAIESVRGDDSPD